MVCTIPAAIATPRISPLAMACVSIHPNATARVVTAPNPIRFSTIEEEDDDTELLLELLALLLLLDCELADETELAELADDPLDSSCSACHQLNHMPTHPICR